MTDLHRAYLQAEARVDAAARALAEVALVAHAKGNHVPTPEALAYLRAETARDAARAAYLDEVRR